MREILNQCIVQANRCGDAYWTFASTMFLQVTALVAVLFCLDLVLRRKVRAVVRYWIWLLVFAKLMLPTSLQTPASVAYWLPAGQSISPQITVEPVDFAKPAPVANAIAVSGRIVLLPTDPVPLARLDWNAVILGGWLAGVAILFGMLWRRARTVRRIVEEACEAPLNLQTLLDECLPLASPRLGRVRLKTTARLGCPAICGFFKPTILLPSEGLEKLDREQIRLILLHELVHWRRGDLQVNCLQTALQILYFYNPAVWFAGAVARRVREQAVDETVLVMTRCQADRYASTLLDLAAVSLRPAESMLRLVGVVESRKALAGRIRRILSLPIPKTTRVGLSGLAAIVVLGLLLVPMACSQRPAVSPDSTEALSKLDPVVSTQVMHKLYVLEGSMSSYADEHQRRYPAAAICDDAGKPLLSWRVAVLPYLDEMDLYDQFHLDEPWDSAHNRPLLEKMPRAFYDPRLGDLDGKTVFLVPTGKETMFFGNKGTRLQEITDGLDDTITIVEADAEHAIPWTKPQDFPVDKKRLTAGLQRGKGGALTFAFAIDAVMMLPGDIDTTTLWSFFTPAGGEKIDWPPGAGKRVMHGFTRGEKTDRPPHAKAGEHAAGGKDGKPDPGLYTVEFKKIENPAPSVQETVANKLHRIAQSLVAEKELNGQFPAAAICDKSGKPLLSWRVKLLRFLDEGGLYDHFRLNEPWDSEHNQRLVEKMPDIFVDPHLGDLGGKTVFLLPTGKEMIFPGNQTTSAKQITDGVSKTILLVEADARHAVPWTRPDDLPIDREQPAAGLERWPGGYFMMALADAQILLLPGDIEAPTLWALFTRAGNEQLAWPPRMPGQQRPTPTEANNSQLKTIGWGMLRYESALKRFPPAAMYYTGDRPLLSWRVALLPFVDENDLYEQFHLDEPWDSEHNKPLLAKMPGLYASPRAGDLHGKTVYLAPTGKETLFFDDRGATPEQVADGADRTILVVEVDPQHAVPWTKPDDLPIDKQNPAAGLAKDPNGRFTVLGADGAIHTLPGDIDAATLWHFFTRAGGEKIAWPD